MCRGTRSPEASRHFHAWPSRSSRSDGPLSPAAQHEATALLPWPPLSMLTFWGSRRRRSSVSTRSAVPASLPKKPEDGPRLPSSSCQRRRARDRLFRPLLSPVSDERYFLSTRRGKLENFPCPKSFEETSFCLFHLNVPMTSYFSTYGE